MNNNKNICAIIAEYNPFHNGHKYQIDLVKQQYNNVIIVMSGSFTQRGDMAITDKWSRTKTALLCGADLVLELPAVFALNTAERFAFGGVSLINKLNCVDALSFGSECGDITALKQAALSLINETPEQSEQIRLLMKQGIAYASAREKVFSDVIPRGLLSEPNNILATEYIRHLISSDSTIKPVTHKRMGNSYKSTEINSVFASATAIRAKAEHPSVKTQMPDEAYKIFSEAEKHSISELDSAAVFFIRSKGTKSLLNSPECVEGLENRIFEAAQNYCSINEITDACSTKRYTKAKIRRIILGSMLGFGNSLCCKPPEYARVLGANKKGTEILAHIKRNSEIKIITKASAFKNTDEMFEKDILSTDIYNINSIAGKDYTTSPIIL